MHRSVLSIFVLGCLLSFLIAEAALAFGSGAGTCFVPNPNFHGLQTSGSGGFTIVATKGGSPVTEVLSGDTVDITLSRAGLYRGFLIHANETSSAGPAVGGLAVSNSGTQKLEPACPIAGSGISHTTAGNILHGSDVISWTAPLGLAPGTQVVITAVPVVELVEWYGGGGEISVSLGIAAPVPSLGWPMLVALVFAIASVSVIGLRRIQKRA